MAESVIGTTAATGMAPAPLPIPFMNAGAQAMRTWKPFVLAFSIALSCPGPVLAYKNDDMIACAGTTDRAAAIAGCTRIIDEGSSDGLTTALYERANRLFSQKDFDKAIADYDRLLSLEPEKDPGHGGKMGTYFAGELPKIYGNRGFAHYIQQHFQPAIADLDRSIALDPKNAMTFYKRGIAARAVADYPGAIAAFDKAIALSPRFTGAFNARADSYEKLKDFDRALADYTKSLELEPKDASTYRSRADVYLDKGDRVHAFADYTTGIGMAPGDYLALVKRALAYNDAGERAKAKADFEAVMKLPDVPVAVRGIAQRELARP